MIVLPLLASAVLFLGGFGGHPDGKKKGRSKAAPIIAKAQKELEAGKRDLMKAGKYGCCIKPPKPSKVDGCNMCAALTGSCSCAANLAAGKGVCGECKGGWIAGKGTLNLAAFGVSKPADIPVFPAIRNESMDNAHLIAFRDLITQAKKVLVTEQRFNCCVGKGGCDECAMEADCGCGPNLAADTASKPGDKKKGICGQCLDGQHAGHGRIAGVQPDEITVLSMDDMDMGAGSFSAKMSQEGSGTSWLPANNPMAMRSLGTWQDFDVQGEGFITANWADAGGKRGDSQLFSTSMAMLSLSRTGFTLRGMASLDALNGRRGYPNLFQTGETADGLPLKDRQHPHDLFMELAAVWSKPWTPDLSTFLYVAPIGEPALGTSAFQHRPTTSELPEAPIGHHWNDGTHITYGVVTGGLNWKDKFKFDVSIFNGREPDENRYNFDPIRLNSFSGRVTFNPGDQWSFGTSYAWIKSPEALDPQDNAHRLTANAFYTTPWQGGTLTTGFIFGRNQTSHGAFDAWSLEGAFRKGPDTFSARWEQVDKNELVDVPAGSYRIQKFTLGYGRTLGERNGVQYSLGAYIDWYRFPSSLEAFYGRSPLSLGAYLKLKLGRE